jgi:transcriptional regulator with XRE-family HTH domain
MQTENKGRAGLLQWLRRSRLQRQELARRLGISKQYMTNILSGRRRGGLETLVVIEEVTGVPVKSWAETQVGESAD